MSILSSSGYPYEGPQYRTDPAWQTQLSSRQQYRRDAEETMKAAREILSQTNVSVEDYERARVLIQIAETYMSWSESS